MAKTPINNLKNWFKTGLKPTQEQFWNWMDSFWHKDEKIPTSAVEGLEDALNGKASTAALSTKVDKVEGKSLLSDAEIERLAGLPGQDLSDTIATLLTANLNDLGIEDESEITEQIIADYINSLGLIKSKNEFYILQIEEDYLKVFDLTTDLTNFQIFDLTNDLSNFRIFDLTNNNNGIQISDLTN